MADGGFAAFLEFLDRIGGWEGFEVVGVRTEEAPGPDALGLPAPRLVIELRPRPGAEKRCSRCGEIVLEIHDTTVRRIRDLPIGEWDTWLLLPRARLQCPRCGPTVEAVPWLDRYQRMTKRLADKIAGLAQVLPIKHVAAWFGVSWETVKQIDQRALRERLEPIERAWDGVRVIAVDEFAIHKGHRYATVVLDPETRRVLWVGRGRRREDLRPFFQLLGPARCRALEAAVIDMSEAYALEIRAHCPQAAIVYDLFHVIAKYGRDVIDRVRVDETDRVAPVGLRAGRSTGAGGLSVRSARARRRVVRGARWLLLRNAATLRPAERVRLRELLALNRRLWVAYVLKDALKALWRYRAPAVARRAWAQWYGWAIRSRIPALALFARRLKPMLPGILAHCRYPLNNGVLEGVTNKIKVIKRMAYGFRDDEYFFLKIRAAFPGIP
jgi:transposase